MSRKTFRIKTLFSARCCLQNPVRIVKGIVKDIGISDDALGASPCGCSLATFDRNLNPGDGFHLTLLAPDRDLEVNAVVRKKQGVSSASGDMIYGIEFTDLAPADKKYLEDWLVAHAVEVEYPESAVPDEGPGPGGN